MAQYDIAIIGAGPAGISAAITAKIRNKKILLLSRTPSSEKVRKAHLVENYPGLPHISGNALAKALAAHLKSLDITVTVDTVRTVYALGKYFAIQAANSEYEARTVILATGMTAVKTLPGEEEFLGRGVSYCATCDAALYKGKTAAVVAYSPQEATEALFLAETAGKVLYFPVYSCAEQSVEYGTSKEFGAEPVTRDIDFRADSADSREAGLQADSADSREVRSQADSVDSREVGLQADSADSHEVRLQADSVDFHEVRSQADSVDSREAGLQAAELPPEWPKNVELIHEIPQKVEGDQKAERLLTNERAYPVDGIFFLRESIPTAQLVPGLQMDGRHIAVNRKMETNLAGCFACGDITGTPYQYIKAAGEGNIAALSAAAFLV